MSDIWQYILGSVLGSVTAAVILFGFFTFMQRREQRKVGPRPPQER